MNFKGEELRSRIANDPPGTWILLPNALKIGIRDLPAAIKNYGEGTSRVRRAIDNGFWIEAINLRVQHTEMWLRVLLAGESDGEDLFPEGDRSTFGQIIGRCVRLLPQDLFQRLQAFNRGRIASVHLFLLGGATYDDFCTALDESFGIDLEVFEIVLAKVGTTLTSDTLPAEVGSFVVERSKLVESLK